MGEAKKTFVGGRGIEFEHFANRVITGMLVGAPTSASTQATGASGASDYNVDITPGILAVDGVALEFAVQADFAIGNDSAEMIVGQSKIYTIIAVKSLMQAAPRLQVVKGAAATTGAQVAPTDDEIDAMFADNTKWFRLAEVTVNRTADTTVTQSQNNAKRPLLIPETVHKPFV